MSRKQILEIGRNAKKMGGPTAATYGFRGNRYPNFSLRIRTTSRPARC